MRISIIQSDPVWENKEVNLCKLSEIMKSLHHKTDIVILPEMFSTGFSMNTDLSEEYYGNTFSWMKKQADMGGYAVCGSYMVRARKDFFNRFVFVTSDDDYYYDKRHLFSMGDEDKFFGRGEARVIFAYQEMRVSPFICYDLRFPVWSRNRDDYDLAIYVSSWPEARIGAWNTLLRARAIENQCYVAGSNRIGKDGNGMMHNGRSQIIDPRGEIIVSAQMDNEEIISAELSMQELLDFRKRFDVLSDADDFKLNH